MSNQTIHPIFRNEHLQTEKANDFAIFAQIVEAMADGHHRTNDGMQNILALAYQMNGAGRYRRQDFRKHFFEKPSETIRRSES